MEGTERDHHLFFVVYVMVGPVRVKIVLTVFLNSFEYLAEASPNHSSLITHHSPFLLFWLISADVYSGSLP